MSKKIRGLVLWTTLEIGCHEVDVELTYTYYPAEPRRPDCPPEREFVAFEKTVATQIGEFEREGREDWFADLDWIAAEHIANAMCDDGMNSPVCVDALRHARIATQPTRRAVAV